VTARAILGVLPSLVDEIDRGTFSIDAVRTPLSDVERIWSQKSDRANERIVFTPGG